MRYSPSALRGPHRLSIVVLAFAGLLVWWGAAVTTKDVGLAVPDWPLSFGQVNPDGWLGKEALLLEHGHRSIASFVGTLTAILFLWIWLRSSNQKAWVFAEFLALSVGLAAIVVGVSRGYTFESANSQAAAGNIDRATGDPTPWFALAAIVGVGVVVWFVWSWAKRRWSLPLKLSGLALICVELQAVLGGLRVTEMSNAFGVIHGCFGQAFFCLLLLMVLVTSQSWESRPLVPQKAIGWLRIWGCVLFATVFGQLIVGATMRHTHRIGLAADDIVTTGGTFLPDFSNFDLTILFTHKSGAVIVFLVVFAFAGFALRHLSEVTALLRAAITLVVLVCVQVCLGIFVLETGKSFWVTNFHVLTGLCILSCAFFILAKGFSAVERSSLLAAEPSSGAVQSGLSTHQESSARHV
ncbi:MAG: COX15/CtaA family protein [Verrucomicrobiae bacterium]|nr:COX15/CtaA family protein [Verrucomicrobiae bacterium]